MKLKIYRVLEWGRWQHLTVTVDIIMNVLEIKSLGMKLI